MDEFSKDVVGARINLDMSKILPAFKQIDEGARNNAESFQVLNASLSETQKKYAAMASAADKSALTSEERRKKILAESEALVKQRTAQAELLTAKKNQLDQTNKITDEKLKAQQLIVQKRNDSILQQEKEHQQRMAALQQKTAAAGSQENLAQAKIDRQFQIMKNGHRKLELEEERHYAKMTQQAQVHQARMERLSNGNAIFERSGQYLLAGTMYYSFIQGAREAIGVIKDFEYQMVNIKRVMGDTADIEFVKRSAIDNAKEYGYALRDVAEVQTQIAQQGFNERQTKALTSTSLMAANVEQSFKDAAQAQELMTGAILNLGLAAEDSERLLDKLNEVSNNFPTTSKKILEGMNRVGASATNAKVEVNDLIGYLTVLNQAGFTGSVAGNAIKSFISFSSRDIAIEKLEKYVGTIKQANGDMMGFSELLGRISEQWDTLSDAQRHEITQAVARGDQASRFIALMNNYSKAMDVATVAENSFGSAQRENALTMSTLEKQSLQLKATWDEFVVTLGDSGLLAILKEMVRTGTLLIDGFNSLPEPIKNTITVTLLLGTAIMALNTGMRLMTGQSLIAMVQGLVAASRSMLGLKVATDAANVSQKAFIATPIGAILTGIALAVGVVTTAWSYYKGAQNEVIDSTVKNERDTYALVERYKELKAIIDSNTASDKEITQAKSELATVIERISKIMPELVSGWDENGKAIDIAIEKVKVFTKEYKDALAIMEQEEIKKSEAALERAKKNLDFYKERAANPDRGGMFGVEYDEVKVAENIVRLSEEIEILEAKILNSRESLQSLNGTATKTTAVVNVMSDGMEDGSESADEMADSVDDVKTALKDASSAIAELNKLQADLKDGQSLNASAAADLIMKYPELTDKIYKTADGYAFESDAVEALRKAKIQMAIDALEAEKSAAENTMLATQDRLNAYGIEMQGIRDLAELKSKLLGAEKKKSTYEDALGLETTPAFGPDYGKLNPASVFQSMVKEQMEEEDAALNNIKSIYDEYFKTMEGYDNRLKTLSDLYSDPNFGVNSDDKSSSKDNDPFEYAKRRIEHEKAMDRLSLEEELGLWQELQMRYAIGTEERLELDEKVHALKKEIAEKISEQEKETYQASLDHISHQKAIREVSAKEELAMLQELQIKYKAGSEERMKLDEMVYAAKKALLQESFSFSEQWISHEKAMGRLSTEDELAAWRRIQSRYAKGTEQRRTADEQVHALKMQLLSDEENKIKDMFTLQTEGIEKLREKSIKAIEDERDAYLKAQDEKIKAIDDLIEAERKQNEDEDYESELAKKQARLKLLESAVGPEGIQERRELLAEIERMELERKRTLRERSLEEEKKRLEEERDVKEEEYDQQISDLEQHYADMIESLKGFGSDVESEAEVIKQIQIMKESEKNAEILRQLDTFIAEYQSRMSKIAGLNVTTGSEGDSSESDLAEYNANKDAWEKAKLAGNVAVMERLKSRNQAIRDKYGIVQDTGKLQQFSEGGRVKGLRGQAVPVVAHAGEMVLNDIQQSNLFKLLNLSLPSISFSMPNLAMAAGSHESVVNHNYYTVSTGDVNIDDPTTARAFWSERDDLVRRFQSRGGGKSR